MPDAWYNVPHELAPVPRPGQSGTVGAPPGRTGVLPHQPLKQLVQSKIHRRVGEGCSCVGVALRVSKDTFGLAV
jgi:hypothetical protein